MKTFEEYILFEDAAAALGNNPAVPGMTTQDKLSTALDTINMALDGIGIVDISGTADGTNAVIYGLRALAAKDPDQRKAHMYNALISGVSALPFGDLAKLLKLRKMGKVGRVAVQGAKVARTVARTARNDRFNQGMGQVGQPQQQQQAYA